MLIRNLVSCRLVLAGGISISLMECKPQSSGDSGNLGLLGRELINRIPTVPDL
jgi:hypothetical protein